MGKQKEQQQSKNKQHKGIRQKLQKKRQQKKKHKKEKKAKHEQYDAEQKKQQFFQQRFQKANPEINIKKVYKYLKKFYVIYQDNLDDFYDIFITLDKNGEIDIGEVENKKIQKYLKKMFRGLPLTKKKMIFRKKEGVSLVLKSFVEEMLSEIMNQYVDNLPESDEESSDQEEIIDQDKIQAQNKHLPNIKKQNIDAQEVHQIQTIKPQSNLMGPFLSADDREKLSEIFTKQIQAQQQERLNAIQQQNDQFDRIIGMASLNPKRNKPNISQKIPQHLLAEGSAQIGEKVGCQDNYFQDYDKKHRPKRLIDEHRQIMSKGQPLQIDKKQRRPFDRQKDIVRGPAKSVGSNSIFFNFKDRMTKPKSTNSFL